MTDRREFIRTSAGVFFVASAGSSFGGIFGAVSDRIRVALVG